VEPLLDEVQVPSDFAFVVDGSPTDPRSVRLRIVRQQHVIAERSFDPGPDRCERLHAAVGLTIALAINAAQEQARERTRDWSLAAAALGDYGVVPRLAPGVELNLRRQVGDHARLRLGLVAVAAFDAALTDAAAFDATLIAIRADGCARATLASALHADGCLGLLGGGLYAAGRSRPGATSTAVPWLALSAAAALELGLSERWALALGVSGTWLLHRVEVGLEDGDGARLESRALDRFAFALGFGPAYYF